MSELRDRSHVLFGRQRRLELWAAIARRSPGQPFTNKDLATELGLPTGEVSKELAALLSVGLVTDGPRAGTKPYYRIESAFWAACSELLTEWSGGETPSGMVTSIR